MKHYNIYFRYTLVLMALSLLARGVIASVLELGNDEVYYRLYALFQDWSHFDHPGMVGWMISLFTFNLAFDSELAIRSASLFLGTLNIFIIYLLGRELKDERCGWHAALLYVSSLYATVICGLFIMPDTPMSTFWLLSLLFFLKAFMKERHSGRNLILAGLFCGLSFLSKYTALFLWLGAGLYVLFMERGFLKRKELYLSLFVTALCMVPVLIWNIQNDFISFTFHSERVSSVGALRMDLFFREIGGEFLYNNPILVVLTIIASASIFKRRKTIPSEGRKVLFLIYSISLPLILIFWAIALRQPTLPHWSSPSYITLLLPVALWIGERDDAGKRYRAAKWAAGLLGAVLIVAVVEIQSGVIRLDKHSERELMGRDDFTLDMYGWDQLEEKFASLRGEAVEEGKAAAEDPLISFNWFPAAHLDYYVAAPLGMDLFCIGPLENIHKYSSINTLRGGLHDGMDGWFIVSSRQYTDPHSLYGNPDGDYFFEDISFSGEIPIERCGSVVYKFYVYRLKDLKINDCLLNFK